MQEGWQAFKLSFFTIAECCTVILNNMSFSSLCHKVQKKGFRLLPESPSIICFLFHIRPSIPISLHRRQFFPEQ